MSDTETERTAAWHEKVIVVKATTYIHVNVQAYNREYGESNTPNQIRDDIKERVNEAVRSELAYLSPAVSVEY